MKQYFDFGGKVALVTGGSRGLGRSIALALAEQGADVVVASRKQDSCDIVVRQIEELGRKALGISTHMGKWDEIDRLVDMVYASFGRIDILVNNAGMSPIAQSSLDVGEALFDKVLAVNFKGPFRLAACVGSRMAAGQGGSIINISSLGAIRPEPDYGPYAGAKAALNAITVAHAREYAPTVRVNAIMAGSFRTDVSKAWSPDREASIPTVIKRYGEPEEIISAVLYLASQSASYTTGSVMRVDGGWT